jgi:hypothetical protein
LVEGKMMNFESLLQLNMFASRSDIRKEGRSGDATEIGETY